MHSLKFAFGAAAAALLAIAAAPATAATVVVPVSFSGGLGTIMAFTVNPADTYDFTFSVVGSNDTLAQMQASTKGPVIQPISFELFSGAPGGGTMLGASVFTSGANLEEVIPTGSYYLELSAVAMKHELVSGSIELSATPEPASWAVMLVGIGGLGLAMRTLRRKQPSAPVQA